MAKIKTKHLFQVARCLKKLEVNVTDIPTKRDGGSDVIDTVAWAGGIVDKIIQNMGEAETEVTELFSDILGVSPDAFLEMDLKTAIPQIKEAFKDVDLGSFFGQAPTK